MVDVVDEAVATSLLLHAVWSVVQAARGVEALHGCVVERDGRAVAIQGHSGSGKSTAGVSLLDRGWRLVADDLIVFDGSGSVVPGPPFVRLAPGRGGPCGPLDPGGKIRVFAPSCPVPVPLAGMVVLVEGAGVGIRRLVGLEAVDAVLTQVYNPIKTHPGQSRRRLDLALAVVARTPVFAAPPRSLTGDHLERLIEEAVL